MGEGNDDRLSRRHFGQAMAISIASAVPLLAATRFSWADGVQPGQSTDGSGERKTVYLDYTQEDLDKAYDQRVWAPNADAVLKRQSEESATIRQQTPPQTFQYGPTEAETLDVFTTARGGAPIHVHLHGGAWRALTKEDVSFPAPAFTKAGMIYVALNFATIPKVRLPEMIRQAQNAIGWLYANAARFGGDPARIHLSGHSSGGHMAAVLMTTDWHARFGLPPDILKSGTLMSGMYDLAPVMLSSRSKYVSISAEEQLMLSPSHHVSHLNAPVIVAFGDRETPEFKRQAKSFASLLKGTHRNADLIDVGDFNHFEVLDVFADTKSELSKAIMKMMAA